MKEFWLVLNTNTFIWVKGSDGIVYNSENYKSFTFSNSGSIKNIYEDLVNLDNLYSVSINSDLLKDRNVCKFIECTEEIQAGRFIEKKLDEIRPTSYIPILKIQDDINILRIRHKAGKQNNEILRNLTEITIHLNGDKDYNALYYKQFTALSNSDETLSTYEIKKFMDKCCKEYIVVLNLVGDFAKYKEKDLLFEWLKSETLRRYNLFTSLNSWLSPSFPTEWFCEEVNVELTVIIDNIEFFETVDIIKYESYKYPIKFCFPISSEHDYNTINMIIENKKINLFEIIPIFNGNNIDFFKNYVYTSISDIELPGFNKREVFSNQVINNNFFGKFVIMPDKKVYTNINLDHVGETNNSIYSLIFNELDHGLSWRMIRDKKPCTDCLYQWLCPSPSNYELIIGKHNLCNILPE